MSPSSSSENPIDSVTVELDAPPRSPSALAPSTPVSEWIRIMRFARGELVALCVQSFVFLFAFMLATSFLADSAKVTHLFVAKVGDDAFKELLTLLFAITCFVGVLAMLAMGFPSMQQAVAEVVKEVPRSIYAFGGSGSAACACLLLRAHLGAWTGPAFSEPMIIKLAVMLWLVSFLYGCGLSYIFNRQSLLVAAA